MINTNGLDTTFRYLSHLYYYICKWFWNEKLQIVNVVMVLLRKYGVNIEIVRVPNTMLVFQCMIQIYLLKE